MDSFGPIAPPLARPVEVPDSEAFVVTPSVGRVEAEGRAREAILEGVLRPADIEHAEIAPGVAVYTPIWRVDASVEGFHVGLRVFSGGRGGVGGILPTGGARHRDRVLLVLGRRLLAFDPTDKIEIRLDQMTSRTVCRVKNGEVLGADVTRAAAEEEAKSRLLREVQPTQALYASFETRVRSTVFVHYPVWLVRYRYRGEAARDGSPEECHVAISARSGKVVSARHPSAWRSVTERVKGWFK